MRVPNEQSETGRFKAEKKSDKVVFCVSWSKRWTEKEDTTEKYLVL